MTYPEHDKMAAIQRDSEVIGEFLDWLLNQRGYVICEASTTDDRWKDDIWLPAGKTIETHLAEYFDIDLKKLEEEKKQTLQSLREANA